LLGLSVSNGDLPVNEPVPREFKFSIVVLKTSDCALALADQANCRIAAAIEICYRLCHSLSPPRKSTAVPSTTFTPAGLTTVRAFAFLGR
jgi:hypothetical protein